MDRQRNTGTANPDTGNPLASGNEVNATAPRGNPGGGARAGARQAADTMRIADGGTTGPSPVADAAEAPKEPATGVTRDGGTTNTAPAAGYYDTTD